MNAILKAFLVQCNRHFDCSYEAEVIGEPGEFCPSCGESGLKVTPVPVYHVQCSCCNHENTIIDSLVTGSRELGQQGYGYCLKCGVAVDIEQRVRLAA